MTWPLRLPLFLSMTWGKETPTTSHPFRRFAASAVALPVRLVSFPFSEGIAARHCCPSSCRTTFSTHEPDSASPRVEQGPVQAALRCPD
eukprot:scaffold29_cov251-Pinguiococcus_pyrenoidosus.AAC.40